MEFEKYTDRAKGFVQAAQTLAVRSGHQRLLPEHLLKVLLEDKDTGLLTSLTPCSDLLGLAEVRLRRPGPSKAPSRTKAF